MFTMYRIRKFVKGSGKIPFLKLPPLLQPSQIAKLYFDRLSKSWKTLPYGKFCKAVKICSSVMGFSHFICHYQKNHLRSKCPAVYIISRRVSIFPEKEFPLWKWNDPEICCVNRNSGIIPDQMKTGMFSLSPKFFLTNYFSFSRGSSA